MDDFLSKKKYIPGVQNSLQWDEMQTKNVWDF